MILVAFEVNGVAVRVEVCPQDTLLDVLRHSLGLLGSKEGCAEGECGACTVLLDDLPVTACLVLAAQVEGRSVTTIEGVASRWGRQSGRGEEEELHPVQEAFIEKDALMCGFCTPGFVVSTKALLDQNNNPTLEEVKRGVSGNICRCGTYPRVFEAALAAAQKMRNGG